MYPFVFIAGAAAVYFAIAAIHPPRPAKMLAAILWAAYAPYEYLVANGTLCDANCNIRVDLVLFLPLLGWATYLALQKQPRLGAVTLLAVICLLMTAWLGSAFGNRWVAAAAGLAALIAAAAGWRAMRQTDRT